MKKKLLTKQKQLKDLLKKLIGQLNLTTQQRNNLAKLEKELNRINQQINSEKKSDSANLRKLEEKLSKVEIELNNLVKSTHQSSSLAQSSTTSTVKTSVAVNLHRKVTLVLQRKKLLCEKLDSLKNVTKKSITDEKLKKGLLSQIIEISNKIIDIDAASFNSNSDEKSAEYLNAENKIKAARQSLIRLRDKKIAKQTPGKPYEAISNEIKKWLVPTLNQLIEWATLSVTGPAELPPSDEQTKQIELLKQQQKTAIACPDFYQALRAIHQLAKNNRNKKSVFVSYAWPSEERKSYEDWIQDFLLSLKQQLEDAHLKVSIDLTDSRSGFNSYEHMDEVLECDYVILIGTESLVDKHRVGISAVCHELNLIRQKRFQDHQQGLCRVIPLVISGAIEDAVPIEYMRYTVIESFHQAGYVATVFQLLGKILGYEKNEKFLEIVEAYKEKHPNIFSALSPFAKISTKQRFNSILHGISRHKGKIIAVMLIILILSGFYFGLFWRNNKSSSSQYKEDSNNKDDSNSANTEIDLAPPVEPIMSQLNEKILPPSICYQQRPSVDIDQCLSKSNTCVVSGITGSGRTCLVSQYVSKYLSGRQNTFMLWFDQADSVGLEISFKKIAAEFQGLETDFSNLEYTGKTILGSSSFKANLKSYSDILIVFNSVSDISALDFYINEFKKINPNVRILISTEVTVDLPVYYSSIDLNDGLTEAEAIYLLKNATQIDDDIGIKALLATTTDRLPLLLDTIAKYIVSERNNGNDISFADMKEILQVSLRERNKVEQSVRKFSEFKFTQYDVIMLSLGKVSDDAKKILFYCSVLNIREIQYELLNSYAKNIFPELSRGNLLVKLKELVSELNNYSLLYVKDNARRMHNVTAQILREHYRLEIIEHFKQIFGSVKALYPSVSHDSTKSALQQRYMIFRHLKALVNFYENNQNCLRDKKGFSERDTANLYYALANAFYYRGKYEKFILYANKAREIWEAPSYRETSIDQLIEVYNELGTAYHYLNDRHNENVVLVKAMLLYEMYPGQAQTKQATTENNLSALRYAENNFTSALDHLRHAFRLQQRYPTQQKFSIPIRLSNLAKIHENLGHFVAAEQCYAAASEEQYQLDGCKSMAIILKNYGFFAQKNGNDTLAELALTRSVFYAKEMYGKDHPKVDDLQNNLATFRTTIVDANAQCLPDDGISEAICSGYTDDKLQLCLK